MTKLYTLNELFETKVITNSPVDFLKDENNIPKYYKEVFERMADGKTLDNIERLSVDELKQYNKDVTSIIYTPDILKYIWNYRLEAINNSNLDEDTKRKYISEVYQYIEVYIRQMMLLDRFTKGESNIKPDYAFKADWIVKAQNTVAKIKMDLNNLYLQGKLPNTLLLSTDNKDIGILTSGFVNNCEEVEVTDSLNRIGINVNAEDLITSKSR